MRRHPQARRRHSGAPLWVQIFSLVVAFVAVYVIATTIANSALGTTDSVVQQLTDLWNWLMAIFQHTGESWYQRTMR